MADNNKPLGFDEILEDKRPDLDSYNKTVAMSERFKQATTAPDWVDDPIFNTEDVAKYSRDPIVYNEEDLEKVTSDSGTIAWDAFRKGVMDLQSFGDKAEMALGNTLAGVSGNTLGTEMRDRAADSLMKTMEESRFIDSNYGDAETWTSRFVGGGMSMAEMLAIGAATGSVGLGAFVGTTSVADGALNDMAKYQEENGTLDGYETDPVNLALDYGNATFQVASELMLGTGRLINGKALKAGRTSTAIVKEAIDNFIQESAQGAASDLTEVLKGNEDISILTENAAGYLKDGVVAGVLGGAIGGTAHKVNKMRALDSLDKVNRALNPDKSEEEIRKISEEVFNKTEQKALDSFVPELKARNEAINDKGEIREKLRSRFEAMYEDEDMAEEEKAKTIEASTTLELQNILADSIERQIPLASHPALQGEVNELGWFRDGIPEHRQTEVKKLNKELSDLRSELKTENSKEVKDYNKIDELESKIELFRSEIPNKLHDLVVLDKSDLRKMLSEQRELMSNNRAKKEMITAIKERARKASKAQDKEESSLAEKMASGAEKARIQRESKETKAQEKEAKIRSLEEQRSIARAIKDIKLNNTKKTTRQTEKSKLTRAIEQATDDSLRNVLLNHGWADQEQTVKRLTPRQLRAEVKKLGAINPNELIAKPVLESTIEQTRKESTTAGKKKTAKGLFHRSINLEFANDSGILQAWGYSKDDPAINLVFLKNGGIKDWQDIAETLSDAGYLPEVQDSYEGNDWREQQAKDIVLNNPDRILGDVDTVDKIDYTESVGYDMLKGAGYTDEQINNMSYAEMGDALSKLSKQTQTVEDEIDYDQVPDDLYFQESFDLAQENARLDEINPEYTGETINIDGVEKTVYNSNGDRIAKSEPALRNFYKWFGNSEVVDEQGRPLVVYHGTVDRKLKEFKSRSETGVSSQGSYVSEDLPMFFFTNQKDVAEGYGYHIDENGNQTGGVLSLYLKLDSPAFFDVEQELEYFEEELERDDFEALDRATRWFDRRNDYVIDEIEQNEKDGAIIESSEDGSKTFIVYNGEYRTTKRIVEKVLSMNPVSELTGQEFKKDDVPLTTKVNDYYREKYNNQVERNGVGVVKLDMRGIKDSKEHGIGKNKASAFMAVPEVIKNGLIFDKQTNWKERGYNSVSFIAPITINGERYACEVIVKETKDRTGFYLHEVEVQEKLADLFNGSLSTTTESASSKLSIAKKWEKVKSSTRIKSVDNRGTFSEDTGNIYMQKAEKAQKQSKVTGGKDTYRGAYIPEYRFIAKTGNMDASTLNHELAHDWGQEYFRWARSGKASKEFMRSWGAVERAIGVRPNDTYFTYDASEKFARSYEAWLLGRKDWSKVLKINNDDDKKQIEKMMEDYRQELVDIYESLLDSSKYFGDTFGEVGELKPELKDFFERSANFDQVALREERGEITPEQARKEKIQTIAENVINEEAEVNNVDADAINYIHDLQEVENETNRFEKSGGNVNRLQERLDRIAMAEDMAQNDKDLGRYDSHRDMLAVADQADEFVKNRYEDAIKIINGEMAEQDGLYASDVYTALERMANKTGDMDLIDELRNSEVANSLAKKLGQQVAGFRNYKGSGDVDIVSVLNSLDKQLKKSYDKNMNKAEEYIASLAVELKAVDDSVKLDDFFNEMECM